MDKKDDKNHYMGIAWEQAYPNQELRETAQFYAHFFRDYEIRLKDESRKQSSLAKISLDNINLDKPLS